MVAFPKLLLLWTALFLVVFLVPMLFKPKAFIKVIDRVVKNTDLVWVRSFVALLFGLLYLGVYWKLDGTWPMVFAIFGWLSIVKGVVNFWFPGFAQKKAKIFYKTVPMMRLMGIITLIFTVFLVWVSTKF